MTLKQLLSMANIELVENNDKGVIVKFPRSGFEHTLEFIKTSDKEAARMVMRVIDEVIKDLRNSKRVIKDHINGIKEPVKRKETDDDVEN